MEIKINQEIKEYNETMFFGLSVRQFIFAILACASACMLGAAPFAALGFIKYNGMTAEKIAKAWIRSEILIPRKLVFQGENKLIKKGEKA